MTLSTFPPPALIAITGATEHTDFQTGESFYSLTLRSPLRDKPVFVQVERDTAFEVNQLVIELLSAAGVIPSVSPLPTNPLSSNPLSSNPPPTIPQTPNAEDTDSAHMEDHPIPDDPYNNPNHAEAEEETWKDDGRDPEPRFHDHEPVMLRIPRAQESIPNAPHPTEGSRSDLPPPSSPRIESLPVRSKPQQQKNHPHKPKRKPGLDSI